MRLAGFRIRMAAGQPGDRFLEIRFGSIQAALFQRPPAHADIAAGVARIAAQRLVPIQLGRARGMAVLIEMLTGEIQLIGRGYLIRSKWLGRDLAVPRDPAFIDRAIGQQTFAILIENRGEQFRMDFLR